MAILSDGLPGTKQPVDTCDTQLPRKEYDRKTPRHIAYNERIKVTVWFSEQEHETAGPVIKGMCAELNIELAYKKTREPQRGYNITMIAPFPLLAKVSVALDAIGF